jgi:hypothetical protein
LESTGAIVGEGPESRFVEDVESLFDPPEHPAASMAATARTAKIDRVRPRRRTSDDVLGRVSAFFVVIVLLRGRRREESRFGLVVGLQM